MVETDWGGLAWRRMPSTRRTLRNIIRSLPWGHWLGPRGIRTRRNDIGGDRGGAPLADREPGCPGTCRRGGIGVRTAQSGGAIGAGAVFARRAANVSSDRERSAAKSRHNVYPPVKFGLSPVVMPHPALRLKKEGHLQSNAAAFGCARVPARIERSCAKASALSVFGQTTAVLIRI
jgi:hypothetical protein